MNEFMTYLPWIGIAIAVVIVLFIIRWILSLRRVVKPSEVHVVRRTKSTDIYGQPNSDLGKDETAGNVYYEIPIWMPIWGVEVQVLPLSNFSVKLEDYEAYDKDKLPFVVDVTAFFRIADYRQAASRIEDLDTLQEHLTSIVQSAVRSILANDTLDQIMTQRSIYGEKFTEEVIENLKEWGIVPVKSIELMDVRDKEGEKVISNVMEKKKSCIDMESRKEVAKNRQEAREAEIAAEKAIALKEQEKAEEVGKRTADQEKTVGIAQEKSKQEIAEQKKITQEKDMDVIQVKTVRQAEIDKQEVVIKANADKDKQRIDAEAEVIVAGQQKEAQKIEAEAKVLVAEQNEKAATHDAQAAYVKKTKEAEADYFKKTKDAEANLVAAKNEAEGIEAKGSAEAIAKEKLGQAEVTPQISLAKEIGNNEGYQKYLIEIRKVDAIKEVGVEQAKNLGNADIRIIANAGGNLNEGLNSVMELFSAKGGQNLGAMLEALAGSEAGQKLLNKVIKKEDTDNANTGETSKK